MTNEEAKQVVIKQAYGKHWNKVKHLVRDYDGTVETFPFLMEDGYEDEGFFWKTLGLTMDEIEEVYGDCEASRWRPASLCGIENNNGWIRIESDGSNLPEYDSDISLNPSFIVFNINDIEQKNMSLLMKSSANGVIQLFKQGRITHYKPIKEEPKPLY